MPVHIGEVVSEVSTEAPTAPAPQASGAAPDDLVERLRAAQLQLIADRRRTAAEGYDD